MTRDHRTVRTRVAVRVPLGAAGDLVDGAVCVVERLEAVDRAEEVSVRGIQPGMNDTVVELEGRLRLVGDPELPAARRALAEGVGVRDVAELEAVDPVPA